MPELRARAKPAPVNSAAGFRNKWTAGPAVIHHAKIQGRKAPILVLLNHHVLPDEIIRRHLQFFTKAEDVIGGEDELQFAAAFGKTRDAGMTAE